MRTTCLNSIFDLAKIHRDVIFVGSDLGYGVLEEFKNHLPNQFFMEGISEAHIIGMASGMAHDNNVVYVNTIASFLVRRCLEQITLNMALDKANVRLIANGAGIVYGPQGPTHTIIDDIAIMSSIPNMMVLSPADRLQMQLIINETYKYNGPVYIRVARDTETIITSEKTFAFGDPTLLNSGNKFGIVSTGHMSQICSEVVSKFKQSGIEVQHIDVHSIKPFNKELFLELVNDIDTLITVEEHNIENGIYSLISKLFYQNSIKLNLYGLGLDNRFIETYGTHDDLLRYFNLDSDSIYRFCKTKFN